MIELDFVVLGVWLLLLASRGAAEALETEGEDTVAAGAEGKISRETKIIAL